MPREKFRFDEAKCYRCQRVLKLEFFHKDATRSNGVCSKCKDCDLEIKRIKAEEKYLMEIGNE